MSNETETADSVVEYERKANATRKEQMLIAIRQLTKARAAAGHQEETGEVCREDCEGCNDPVGQLLRERDELRRTAIPPDTSVDCDGKHCDDPNCRLVWIDAHWGPPLPLIQRIANLLLHNAQAVPPDSEDVGDLVSRSAVVERLREVIADAQDKLGLVPGNMAFEKGRLEAAKSLMKEFEASLADEDLELK